MPPIDALEIWQQLDSSDECSEAVKHCGHYRGKEVLKQGAADFDQPYLTDYYVSEHGYLNMHLKQNLTAFRHCFEDELPRNMLLVDFGCGPMTAGLALADILSKQMPDYKNRTSYFGIDASRNMVNKAKYINEKHELFGHFKVVQGTRFDATEIPHTFPKPQIIVLCFSFVLAPDTFKPDISNEQEQKSAAYELAKDWKLSIESQSGIRKTLVIYLNPKPENPNLPKDNYFDKNWRHFETKLCRSDKESKFCYTKKYVPLPVKDLNNISLSTIRGKLKHGTRK